MRLEGLRLTEGAACGRLLILTAPLSFYGGVDPESGVLVQADHPQHGACLSGRILALPHTSGSTVGSWTLLRMARLGTAPAAIVSATADAVLVTGTLAGGIVHLDGITVNAALDGCDALIPEEGEWLEVTDCGDVMIRRPLAGASGGRPDSHRVRTPGMSPAPETAPASLLVPEDSPLILKLGGSLITFKQSPVPRVDFDQLGKLARLLAANLKAPAVILHGAGSFGHGPVARTGVLAKALDDDARRDWGRIQALQYQLSAIVCEALADAGLPVFPFQASALGHLEGGRFVLTDVDALRRALLAGFIPVLYGTPCFTEDPARPGIASGDDLAPALALALGFSRVVHLTDVAGVHTEDPRKNPAAPVIPWITAADDSTDLPPSSGSCRPTGPTVGWTPPSFADASRRGAPTDAPPRPSDGLTLMVTSHRSDAATATTTTDFDVTGGMAGKVKKLYDVAADGVTSWIVDGRDETAVAAALAGVPAGTVVCAKK
jgi:hypothetical protein